MLKTPDKGLFISFEGIDGCGKTTQVRSLSMFLEEHGFSHEITREPGGTLYAEKIRELILDPGNQGVFPETELLLYFAARAQHVREKILPLVEQGITVISDRFSDATIAYQGYGRGLDKKQIEILNGFSCGGVMPDITFILDIESEVSRKRMAAAGKRPDRIEREPGMFFERIRQGYLEIASSDKKRVTVFDGSRDPESIAKKINKKILEKINERS